MATDESTPTQVVTAQGATGGPADFEPTDTQEDQEAEDLPEEVRLAQAVPTLTSPLTPEAIRPLNQIEQEYILSALAANNGNQRKTARQLGITDRIRLRPLVAASDSLTL